MFFCKHCGYSCHNEGVNCCNNIKCRYYCCSQKDGDLDKNCDRSNGKRGADGRSRRENHCGCDNDNQIMPHDSCSGLRNQEKCKCEKRLVSRGGYCEDGGQAEFEKGYDKGMGKDCGCKTYRPVKDCFAMPNTGGELLGFATVPFQSYGRVYDKEQALMAGTVFAALDMPYTKRIIRRG